MIKILVVACLVILSTAVTRSHLKAHARTNSTRFVANSTYSSLMQSPTPSWLLEAESKGVRRANVSGDSYGCASGLAYLNYQDEVNNRDKVCGKLSYWAISRLQGGGSADGQGYSCRSRPSDGRNLGDSVCVKTSFAQIKNNQGSSCGDGWSTPTVEEAENNKQELCAKLGTWDIARIGVQGSMDGPGYGCKSRDWDDRGVGNVLCVQRNLLDIQNPSTPKQENLCSSGESLVTVQEAVANRQAYCNLLDAWTIARLAGGGSFDGSGYGCKIRNLDRRSLGDALCASNNR